MWPVPLIDLILMSLNVQAYTAARLHTKLIVWKICMPPLVSAFLRTKKYLYTLHSNNCVRKLLTVDVFAAFIVSKRMHAIAQN